MTDDENSKKRLGDFEIIRELGRGGMGVVFEARQVSLNRKVALKVISGSLGLSSKAVLRFQREAEAAGKLHHTNIVPIYFTGEDDGTHYYAMELIDGPSLQQVIGNMRKEQKDASPAASSPPEDGDSSAGHVGLSTILNELPSWVTETFGGQADPGSASASSSSLTASDSSSSLQSGAHYFDTVARMIAEVADALDHAHENGVIHRDIKPANLLLSPDGRLSVNDFGLARMLEQPGMTMSGEFVGSPLYMSPQQITAGRVPLDHRTDVYSLGATLYELLTLAPPFPGRGRDEVMAQILHKEPRRPRSVNKKVPVDLETICLKALEKDPDQRYQTAGQLAEDLRRFINRFEISAKRAGPVRRVVKWARRNRAVAALGACLLVVGVAAGLFAWRSHVAELRVTQVELEKAKEYALLSAMSGDLDAVEEQIAQAEQFGASTGWVRLFRGGLALHRDHHDEAVEHLEQAVALMPESAAAFGMLAHARLIGGDEAAYFSMIGQLTRMEPDRDDRFLGLLFKGLGLAFSPEGLEHIDQAIAMRPASPVARSIRAGVRQGLAMETANLEEADRAIKDLEAAMSFLPDSPGVIAQHLMSYLVRANILKENGDADGYREALAVARADASKLEMYPDNLSARRGRVHYYEQAGDFERAREAACGDGLDLTDDQSYLAFDCAKAWYSSREHEKALAAFDRARGRLKNLCPWARRYVEAEMTDDHAALADEFMRELRKQLETPAATYAFFFNWTALRLMGDSKYSSEFAAISRKRLAERRRGASMALADYMTGELSADALIAAAREGSRTRICEAHYVVGMDALANGDRETAAHHFRKSIETNHFVRWAYDWSHAFLERLEEDPTWPKWIDVKDPAGASRK